MPLLARALPVLLAAATLAAGAAQRVFHQGLESSFLVTAALVLLVATLNGLRAWRGAVAGRGALGSALAAGASLLAGVPFYPLPAWTRVVALVALFAALAETSGDEWLEPARRFLARRRRPREKKTSTTGGPDLAGELAPIALVLVAASVAGAVVDRHAFVLVASFLLPLSVAAFLEENLLRRIALAFAIAPAVHAVWQLPLLVAGVYTVPVASGVFGVLLSATLASRLLRASGASVSRACWRGFASFSLWLIFAVLAGSLRAVEDPVPRYYNSQHAWIFELARVWAQNHRLGLLPYESVAAPMTPLFYGPSPLPFVLPLHLAGKLSPSDPALGLLTVVFNAAAVACLASALPRAGARAVALSTFAVCASIGFLNGHVLGDYFDRYLHHDSLALFYGCFWPSFLPRLSRRLTVRDLVTFELALGSSFLGKPQLVLLPVAVALVLAVRERHRLGAAIRRVLAEKGACTIAVAGMVFLVPGAAWYGLGTIETGHPAFPHALALRFPSLAGSFPMRDWDDILKISYGTAYGTESRWERLAPWIEGRFVFLGAFVLLGRAALRTWKLPFALWSAAGFALYASLPLKQMSSKYVPVFDTAVVFGGAVAILELARSLSPPGTSPSRARLAVLGLAPFMLVAFLADRHGFPGIGDIEPARWSPVLGRRPASNEAALEARLGDYYGLALRMQKLPANARVLAVDEFDHEVFLLLLSGKYDPLWTVDFQNGLRNIEIVRAPTRRRVAKLLAKGGYTHVLVPDDETIRTRLGSPDFRQPLLEMILERNAFLRLEDRQRGTRADYEGMPLLSLYALDYSKLPAD